MDEWINKIWYMHTMENYSALERKILTHDTSWMNLEDVLLSEINWSQKDKCHMIPLNEVPRVVKFIGTESTMVIVRGCRIVGMRSYCLMGIEFQVFKLKRVLKMDGGDGCTTM